KELRGHTAQVLGAALLPDGKRAVTGGMDRSLRVWDVDSGRQLRVFENVPDDVHCLAISPDGKLVAVGHTIGYEEPGAIRLWDVASGALLYQTAPVGAGLLDVVALPDSRHCLTCGKDGVVRLWQWKR